MDKILLDENVPIRIKEQLEQYGYKDVKHINEVKKGLTDDEVYNIALTENRIIISGDNHFKKKEYIYRCGIIYITSNAMRKKDVIQKIDWLNKNLIKYNIDKYKALIFISGKEYSIRYLKEKSNKEKEKKIDFSKIKFNKVINNRKISTKK